MICFPNQCSWQIICSTRVYTIFDLASCVCVWSCMFLVQGVSNIFISMKKCLFFLVSHPLLVWHPEKYPLPLLQNRIIHTQIYIYIYIYESKYIYIYCFLVCIQGWFAPSNTMSLDSLIFSQQHVKNVKFNFSY